MYSYSFVFAQKIYSVIITPIKLISTAFQPKNLMARVAANQTRIEFLGEFFNGILFWRLTHLALWVAEKEGAGSIYDRPQAILT